jgi:hypothetical protein
MLRSLDRGPSGPASRRKRKTCRDCARVDARTISVAEARRYTRSVTLFRRVMLVLGVAGAIGLLARFRGKGGVPPTSGGWRELEAPTFR